jgi:ketosteroid isomerase-like protein
MPQTDQIAADFAALCRAGKLEEAGAKYWAKDVISLEPMDGPMARSEGIDAVKAKSDWWYNAHDVHKVEVSGPAVNGDQFMLHFDLDVTEKESGKRMQMSEEALYKVADGKIVEERFFFSPQA